MAFPTAVNSQITDAVTQNNTSVLGDAPAVALGNLYQFAAQSVGLALQNAASAQQQMAVLQQAVTTLAVSQILGAPPAGKNANGPVIL